MPDVALLSARPDLSHILAQEVENRHPKYNVDTYTSHDPIRRRLQSLVGNQYDLIQVDELLRNGPLGTVFATLRDTKLIAFLRGWADYTNAHEQHGYLHEKSILIRSREVLRHADRVLFVSEVCRQMISREFPTPPSSVVNRPFNIEQYSQIKRTETDSETITLLTVTNLRYEQKARGVCLLIQSLEPLFEQYDIKYRVVGGGRAASTVKDSVRNSNYTDRIEFLGHRNDIPQLLADADIFVYLSFLDSLSMTVLEAQAAGLPVVVGGTSGVAEAAGTAGCICPPTVEGMRDGIDKLLSNPGRRHSFATASKKRILNYNETAADAFVNNWDEILI